MKNSATENWQDLTLYQLLTRAARKWRDRVALVTPRRTYTFAQILDDVHALAGGLLRLGVNSDDRVATLFGTRSEWVILHFAAALLGAKLVPLNTRFQADELRDALVRVQATVLVAMDRDGNQDLLARVSEICPELANAPEGKIASRALPHLRRVIVCSASGARANSGLDYRRLIDASQQIDLELLNRHSGSVDPDDTAIILFTSGSTSRPKAAMLSHQNVIGHAHYLSRFLEMQPSDRYINLLPFFHIAGYVQGLILNLYAGSTLYLLDNFKTDEILNAITRHRITAWAGMPVTIQRVLDLAREKHADLSSLQKQHGVSPELWDRVTRETGAAFVTRMYGLTESAGLVTMSRPAEKDRAYWRNSVGLPLPGVVVRVVDPQTNQELPRGQAGEIAFKGWNCFKGYYGDPEATAATIDHQGYCHTGDQGFVDADGCLHLLGRYKEIIKTGGENVSALELELWLKQHISGIRAICVIGVPDPTWGEAVAAIIEPEQNARLDPETITAECAAHLASFKVPRYVLLISSGEWHYTGSGKIDRSGLRDWAIRKLADGA
jgi:fatty-acyl-CoA synthase